VLPQTERDEVPVTCRAVVSLACALSTVLVCAAAHAAPDPTTADCLAASDASLEAGNQHKLRAERAQLLVCSSSACPADVRVECSRRVSELNGEIPTIVFEVKDPGGRDLTAVQVSMDGEVIAQRLEGTAISIDPGEHTFAFDAVGLPRIERRLVIRVAEKDRREAVALGTADPGAPAPAAPVAPTDTTEDADARGLRARKVAAIAAAGVGVAGIAVGSVFGLVALSRRNDARDACPGVCLNAADAAKWSSAKSAGTISTVAFVVGGVGAAGAAILWLTLPRRADSPSGAQIGLGPGGVQFTGAGQ
jgi:hypothetical protein